MPGRGFFVDTWGWIALGQRREARHKEIVKFYSESLRQKRYVCTGDYVLDELITPLYRRERALNAERFIRGIMASAALGSLTIERVHAARFDRAWELRNRLADKPRISFTDLTSMIIMTELGIREVLTEDDHFLHVGLGLVRVP